MGAPLLPPASLSRLISQRRRPPECREPSPRKPIHSSFSTAINTSSCHSPVHLEAVPLYPLHAEPALLIAPPRALVISRHPQRHPVQPQVLKGVAQHQAHGFGAIALPPTLRVLDPDPQVPVAVGIERMLT